MSLKNIVAYAFNFARTLIVSIFLLTSLVIIASQANLLDTPIQIAVSKITDCKISVSNFRISNKLTANEIKISKDGVTTSIKGIEIAFNSLASIKKLSMIANEIYISSINIDDSRSESPGLISNPIENMPTIQRNVWPKYIEIEHIKIDKIHYNSNSINNVNILNADYMMSNLIARGEIVGGDIELISVIKNNKRIISAKIKTSTLGANLIIREGENNKGSISGDINGIVFDGQWRNGVRTFVAEVLDQKNNKFRISAFKHRLAAMIEGDINIEDYIELPEYAGGAGEINATITILPYKTFINAANKHISITGYTDYSTAKAKIIISTNDIEAKFNTKATKNSGNINVESLGWVEFKELTHNKKSLHIPIKASFTKNQSDKSTWDILAADDTLNIRINKDNEVISIIGEYSGDLSGELLGNSIKVDGRFAFSFSSPEIDIMDLAFKGKIPKIPELKIKSTLKKFIYGNLSADDMLVKINNSAGLVQAKTFSIDEKTTNNVFLSYNIDDSGIVVSEKSSGYISSNIEVDTRSGHRSASAKIVHGGNPILHIPSTKFYFSNNAISVPEYNISIYGASVHGRLNANENSIRASGSISMDMNAILNKYDIAYTGDSPNGHFTASLVNKTPSLVIELSGGEGAIIIDGKEIKVKRTFLKAENSGSSHKIAVVGVGDRINIKFNADGSGSLYPGMRPKISGKATMHIDASNGDIITTFFPEIDPVKGHVQVNIECDYPSILPTVNGDIRGDFDRIGILAFGTGIDGSVIIKMNKRFGNFSIDMNDSEGGNIFGGGRIIKNKDQIIFRNIKITNMQTHKTVDSDIQLGGAVDIAIDYSGESPTLIISGKINIAHSKILITDDLPRLPDDMERDTKPDSGSVALDVNATISELEIDKPGARITLDGGMLLNGDIDNISATGKLDITSGDINFKNIGLHIEKGSFIKYSGSIENPEISIKARKSIKDVIVGVDVNGVYPNLKTSLYSNKNISDENILSYIAFDKALNNSSDYGNLLAIASFLTPGSSIESSLTHILGVDEIRVESNGVGSRVFLSKDINDKITISSESNIDKKTTQEFAIQFNITDTFGIFLKALDNATNKIGFKYRKVWK